MMAMTTSNSMSVNALVKWFDFDLILLADFSALLLLINRLLNKSFAAIAAVALLYRAKYPNKRLIVKRDWPLCSQTLTPAREAPARVRIALFVRSFPRSCAKPIHQEKGRRGKIPAPHVLNHT
jgi:hypothetical protein